MCLFEVPHWWLWDQSDRICNHLEDKSLRVPVRESLDQANRTGKTPPRMQGLGPGLSKMGEAG